MKIVRQILLLTLFFGPAAIASNSGYAPGLTHKVANQQRQAPDACVPRIGYAKMLVNTLGQKKQVSGSAIQENLLELFANPETGTWTLILVTPNGMACEIGNGTDFKIEPQPLNS